MRTIKLCSVVFCVTSSLSVINKIYWCVARRRLLIAGDGRHTRAIIYRRTRPSKCWWHTRRTSTPDICRESRFFHTEPAFDAPVRGIFVGILSYRSVRKNETGVATRRWKRLMICLAVSIEHRRVTDGQTDGQTCCDDTVHAIHSIARYSGWTVNGMTLDSNIFKRTTICSARHNKHSRLGIGGEINQTTICGRVTGETI